MTLYPDPHVRFQLQKGQLSFQGFAVSAQALGLFFLPHSSVRDLNPGTNTDQHRQQKPWATTLPSKPLSHSGIEIWLLDGKQKTLMLTTTPKSASAALGTFPRVSRTGSQQAELFGDNSTSYLTPLCGYYRDTGMVKGILTPSLRSVLSFLQRWVGEEITSWKKSVTQRRIRQLCPKLSTGPGWKFHTGNRNLTVKHSNKLKNDKKNLLWLQMFRSFQSIYKARVGKPDWLWFGVSL